VADLGRWAAWLAGLWGGLLVTIAGVAAPGAFAVLQRADAGRFVGRLFAQEAYVSLAVAVLLVLAERRRVQRSGNGRLSATMLLLLGTLFCTVAGYFAIQPMMAEARAGRGALSFGALHGLSALFFGVKTVLVGIVAFRLTRARTS
jgi:hypothetical protein